MAWTGSAYDQRLIPVFGMVEDLYRGEERVQIDMEEYLSQRYTSEYFPVSVELINEKNVDAYIQEESGE